MRLHADVRAVGFLGAGKALAMAVLLLNGVLLGRVLGPERFGEWSLIVGAATLAHSIAFNWTHPITVRFGAEEWARTRTLRRSLGARLPLILAGLVIATAALLLNPGGWLFSLFALSPTALVAVWVYCLSLWVAGEAGATMQASGAMSAHALLTPMAAALQACIIVACWAAGRMQPEVVALAVASAALVFWGLVWLRALGRTTALKPEVTSDGLRRAIAYGWPLIPTFAVGYASDWGDHLILRAWRPLGELGQFSVAYQIMLTLAGAAGVLTTLLLPRLVQRDVTGDSVVVNYLCDEVPTGLTLWLLGIVWLMAIVPPLALAVAGPAYGGAVGLALLLLVGVPGIGITAMYTVLFNLEHRLSAALLYNVVITAVNLSLSVLLVPSWGAPGACVATACSFVVGQAMYVWDQHAHWAVDAGDAWLLVGLALAAGLTQVLAGPEILFRLVWAFAATAVVVAVARARGLVDAALLARLTAGPLQPVGALLASALTGARTRR